MFVSVFLFCYSKDIYFNLNYHKLLIVFFYNAIVSSYNTSKKDEPQSICTVVAPVQFAKTKKHNILWM